LALALRRAIAHEGARGPEGRPLRVVHRDLCPANVLLSRNGEVKITDFGVARALRDSAAAQTQTFAGHFAYVAPEQASGLPIDPRADLFAVGVMLWELLGGRRLFARDNEAATLRALLSEEVLPMSLVRRDASTDWDAFFERALARDPAQRFGSAREMAAALDQIRGARGDRSPETLAELVAGVVAARASGAALSDDVPTEIVSALSTTSFPETPIRNG
jgi:serine/threonine protein kinase